MSNELIEVVDRIVSAVAQEFDKDASVLVQFAAGEWHALKSALEGAKSIVASGSTPAEADVLPPASAAPSSEPEAAAPSEPVSPAPDSYLPPSLGA